MKTLFKLVLLPALLLFGVVNSANSAFPVEKEVAKAVVVTTLPVTSEKQEIKAGKSELKKELKKFKKDKTHWYSGGKSKIVAALLAFFLGGLGIHSFYLGNAKKGFIQLGLTAIGIALYVIGIVDWVSGLGESLPTLALIGMILMLGVGLWALIDFIRILAGGLEPEEGWDS